MEREGKKKCSPSLEELPSKLSLLRKKSGQEQRSVAKEVGIAASALSAFENGQRIPSLEQAISLAKYYGITLDELCSIEPIGKVAHETPSKADVIRWLTSLCECGMPVSIQPDQFSTSNTPMMMPYKDQWIETTSFGASIRLAGKWLNEFSAKYERLLRLYMDGDIDAEVLEAWKNKRIEECETDYDLDIFRECDFPF